jgi:hypothetical protein
MQLLPGFQPPPHICKSLSFAGVPSARTNLSDIFQNIWQLKDDWNCDLCCRSSTISAVWILAEIGGKSHPDDPVTKHQLLQNLQHTFTLDE